MSKYMKTSTILPEFRHDDLNRNGFVTNYPSSRYWKSSYKIIDKRDNKLNIYIHIPYCIQRCAYCFFKITELSDSNQSEINQYVDYLCKEIKMASEFYELEKRPVDTLYFGGGTPSLLKDKHLDKIMHALHENFNMCLTEFVFEIEPVTYTPGKAKQLSKYGITRMSFGIQSFCDDIVHKTGRKDTEKKNVNAIINAMESGMIVNIDLLSGLEGESMKTWKYSIDRAIDLDVHSITVYKMELYKNSKYFTSIKNNKITLPDDTEELKFINYAFDSLYENNYVNSTYFTFSKHGKYPQKHIISRWQGTDTYGFGVSAFSSLDSDYCQNASNTQSYIDIIDTGKLPVIRGLRLNSKDKIARDIVLGMKTSSIDCDWFKERHGIDLLSNDNTIIFKLLEDDFISINESTLLLTRKGSVYGDYVGNTLSRHILDSII